MKLIELLVWETKNGNFEWPDGVPYVEQFVDLSLFCSNVWKGGHQFEPVEDYERGRVTREQYEAALAASKTEWNGEGLPPVGCEFECSFRADNFSTWHRRRCTATGKRGVLCVDKNDTEMCLNDRNNRFRPIRSEADKKRDEAIKEMILYTSLDANSAKDCNHIANIYDAITAGKIPGVKLSD